MCVSLLVMIILSSQLFSQCIYVYVCRDVCAAQCEVCSMFSVHVYHRINVGWSTLGTKLSKAENQLETASETTLHSFSEEEKSYIESVLQRAEAEDEQDAMRIRYHFNTQELEDTVQCKSLMRKTEWACTHGALTSKVDELIPFIFHHQTLALYGTAIHS